MEEIRTIEMQFEFFILKAKEGSGGDKDYRDTV